ncbi:MAG: glycosyltransferase family 2 protein [Bacteroidia bacterium]
MGTLSLVIIAYNEEARIGDCIRSVASLADEVMVVDSGSTDQTVSIASALGATVLHRTFTTHIEQKNWAWLQSSGDYILSLDADEALSPELHRSIETAKAQGFPAFGFSMNRLNHLGERAIKGCGWYPDRKIRLWKRGAAQWAGENPHDRIEMGRGTEQALRVDQLQGDLLHYTYSDLKAARMQALKFGRIGAQEAGSGFWGLNLVKCLVSPWARFVRNYLLRSGWKYGWDGFVICFWQSVEVGMKYGLGFVYSLS